jgi:hypothetical protein
MTQRFFDQLPNFLSQEIDPSKQGPKETEEDKDLLPPQSPLQNDRPKISSLQQMFDGARMATI